MQTSLFLLADSQLLFWNDDQGIRHRIEALWQALRPADEKRTAAYFGASNGDDPNFFSLFQAAMEGFGSPVCRHIPTDPSAEDLDFAKRADLLLLAGGDAVSGWQALRKHKIDELLTERFYDGAIIVGVSAGAIQLGRRAWLDADSDETIKMLNLARVVIDVHDDPEWERLSQLVQEGPEDARGIGVPSGGGAILHPDFSLEGIRFPIAEFAKRKKRITNAVVMPGTAPDFGEPDFGMTDLDGQQETSHLN